MIPMRRLSMAWLLSLAAVHLLLLLRPVLCWTYTAYDQGLLPTGPVTPTSTSINTTTLRIYNGFHLLVTVTYLYLGPGARACRPYNTNQTGCVPAPSTMPTPNVQTTTDLFFPRVVANPPSCTQTAFRYTTAQTILLEGLGGGFDLVSNLRPQATQSPQLLLATTYVSTISTDLDGAVATTTKCDVYLRSDAVTGTLLSQASREAYLLDQCVDPRKWMCEDAAAATGGCAVSGGDGYPPAMGTDSSRRNAGAVVRPFFFELSAAASVWALYLIFA